MMNTTQMTNDELDNAIVSTRDERSLNNLLNERSRRVQAAIDANLAAEKQYLATGEWPDEVPDELRIVKISSLTSLQMYRIEDAYECIEDLRNDPWEQKKTVVRTTYRMVEALYAQICNADIDSIASYGSDSTEAEADMVRRSALVSRESLSYKLAKVLGWDEEMREHRRDRDRFKKAGHWTLRDAV